MPKEQKRDKAYYMGQLKTKAPELYERVMRDELTAAEALRKAGIKKPNPLAALRREWGKASKRDRQQFIAEVGPDLDGFRPTARAQLAAAWNRCSAEDHKLFLFLLLKTPRNRALFKALLARIESST